MWDVDIGGWCCAILIEDLIQEWSVLYTDLYMAFKSKLSNSIWLYFKVETTANIKIQDQALTKLAAKGHSMCSTNQGYLIIMGLIGNNTDIDGRGDR